MKLYVSVSALWVIFSIVIALSLYLLTLPVSVSAQTPTYGCTLNTTATTINQGQSVGLQWDIPGFVGGFFINSIREAYVNGVFVPGNHHLPGNWYYVTPSQTTTYNVLQETYAGEQQGGDAINFTCSRTITVNQPQDPQPGVPSAPSTDLNCSINSVTLSWGSVSGNDGYNLQVTGSPDQHVSGTSITLPVSAGVNYTWRVQAKNDNGPWGDLSGPGSFYCPASTSGPYSYGPWGNCTASCGGGFQYRTESCNYDSCYSRQSRSRTCNTQSCGPTCVSNEGNTCWSGSNSCGMQNTGTIQCNGSCNAGTPSESLCPTCVSNQGSTCWSGTNSCGMQNTGSIQCNGSCSANTPSESACLPAVDLDGRVIGTTYWRGGYVVIDDGQQVELTWDAERSTYCTADGPGFSTSNQVSGIDPSITEPGFDSSQDYTVTCYDSSGNSASDMFRVITRGAPAISVNIRARVIGDTTWQQYGTLEIDAGEEVEIDWQSTNATACTAVRGADFSTGVTSPTSGTDTSVSEPTAGDTEIFEVQCENEYGDTQNDSITVESTAPPFTVTLEGQVQGESDWQSGTMQISQGDQVSLQWASPSYTSCSAIRGPGFRVPTNFFGYGQNSGIDTTIFEPEEGDSEVFTVRCRNWLWQTSEASLVIETVDEDDTTPTASYCNEVEAINYGQAGTCQMPSCSITAPSSGSVFTVGEMFDVYWTAQNANNVTLNVSPDPANPSNPERVSFNTPGIQQIQLRYNNSGTPQVCQGGSRTVSIISDVLPSAPDISVSANPPIVSDDGMTTIGWNPNGFIGTCRMEPAALFSGTPNFNASDSQSITVNGEVTVRYICDAVDGTYDGGAQTVQDAVNVRIISTISEQ